MHFALRNRLHRAVTNSVLRASKTERRFYSSILAPRKVLETQAKAAKNPKYQAIYSWEGVAGDNVLSMELVQTAETSSKTVHENGNVGINNSSSLGKPLNFTFTKKFNNRVTASREFSVDSSIIDLKRQMALVKAEYKEFRETHVVPHSTSHFRTICLTVGDGKGNVDLEWFILKPAKGEKTTYSSLDKFHEVVMGNLSAWSGEGDELFEWGLSKIVAGMKELKLSQPEL